MKEYMIQDVLSIWTDNDGRIIAVYLALPGHERVPIDFRNTYDKYLDILYRNKARCERGQLWEGTTIGQEVMELVG